MYSDYFRLSEKPFNATPDPRRFYENARYREAAAVLSYGIAERKGFIVLTGEVGTGKTTLLRRLMEHAGDNVRFVFLYNASLTFDQLLDTICAELELPIAGHSRIDKLGHLDRFLLEEAQRGSTVVLLLDEAQHASPEVLEHLRLISNLETATQKLLQIVLVGQPELEVKLADPALRQVRQRVAVRYRLEPLPRDEVEAFIEYRLVRAGRSNQDLFTRHAVVRIAAYSRGIPRLINILCDASLLIAYGLEARRVTARMIDEAATDLAMTDAGAPVATPTASPVAQGYGRVERYRARGVPAVAIGAGAFAVGLLLAAASPFAPGDELLRSGVAGARQVVLTAAAGVASLVPGPPRDATSAPAVADLAPKGPPADPAASSAEGREAQRPTGERLVVTEGTKVSDAIFARYGRRDPLLLDLVCEFNPHVRALDRVAAGLSLLLPPLTFETVARAQSDGTYRIVVASLPSAFEAQRVARTLRHHATAVTRRRVTSTQELHRVEIRDLPTISAARATWRELVADGWFDASSVR